MDRNGFTLVELMIVSVILMILLLLSIPSSKNLTLRHKINGQANDLFSMIYLARTEAIKRSKVVSICKSADGQNCGGNWSLGWLMFVDLNQDGALDVGETVVDAATVDTQVIINWSAFGSDNYIRLTPRGITLAQNGTFTLCPHNGNNDIARTVVVSKLARVRLPEIGTDAGGNPIMCN